MNETEIKTLNEIANKYGYKIRGDEYSLSICKKEPDFYAVEICVHTFESPCDMSASNIWFGIMWPGFGSELKREMENTIYNDIVNAKQCCDELNSHLAKLRDKDSYCNNKECEPPCGGKQDCEFYDKGVCNAH